jgi:hypothetical protein
LTLRVVLAEGAEREALAQALGMMAVEVTCWVGVDGVEFVAGEVLEEGEALMVDERSWD